MFTVHIEEIDRPFGSRVGWGVISLSHTHTLQVFVLFLSEDPEPIILCGIIFDHPLPWKRRAVRIVGADEIMWQGAIT